MQHPQHPQFPPAIFAIDDGALPAVPLQLLLQLRLWRCTWLLCLRCRRRRLCCHLRDKWAGQAHVRS